MTAPAIPDGLEPLGVWDLRGRGWVADLELCHQRIAWAAARIGATSGVFRVEFFLLDAPFARLHRYALKGGLPYCDPATGTIAIDSPALQLLAGLPPAHLLDAA